MSAPTPRQMQALAVPCRTTEEMVNARYLHRQDQWSTVLAITRDRAIFSGSPVWNASVARMDRWGPIPIRKLSPALVRQAMELAGEMLKGAGCGTDFYRLEEMAVTLYRRVAGSELKLLPEEWRAGVSNNIVIA